MAEYNQCLKNAQQIDPKATLCAQWVCEQNTTAAQVAKFCHCQSPYPPPPPGQPCPHGANTPVVVFDTPTSTCFCCCSCFAYGTPVATAPGQYRAIETFAVLDPVLAAGGDLQWKELTVEFSNGVLPHSEHGKTMMTVYYGDVAAPRSLVVTPDHVFLLASGKLKRAEMLVPGTDQLVDPQGNPVALLAKETGGWFGGVHHIATTKTVAVSLEGHLLDSNGVVTGDWAVQIADLEGGALGGILDHAEGAPVDTTDAFMEAHPHLGSNRFAAVAAPELDLQEARPGKFRPYGQRMLEVPEDACTFISRRQAQSILANPTAPQRPVTSIAGQDAAWYLFRLYGAFYPDVHFELVWDELLPNAYSWETFGVKIVVLSGGLVRTPGISFSGLALVLAHEIGHLYGGPPLVPDTEYSCEGQADYAATSAVMRGSFYASQYPATVSSAVEEIRGFFDLIDPKLREGKPGATCNGISTDCRLDAMVAGMMMTALPACAGGPGVDYLVVESAVASHGEGEKDTQVRVSFNVDVNPATVEELRHWVFTPAAELVSAQVDGEDGAVVQLVAQLDPATEYRLTVANVLSSDGLSIENGKQTVPVYWDNPS
jgi:hypothetical protein